jgi:HSP20 family molecular chaperone IbpA
MWADALALVARAEQMRRGMFQPAQAGWEPPVDLLETAEALIVIAALPGVRVADVELVIGDGDLSIIGIRRPSAALHAARVHRMELPHGRFERTIILPPGTYELVRRDLVDGCLTVVLKKVD